MLFYAIAEPECIDCFYDFEIRTFGDGLNKNNLLPTSKLAEEIIEKEIAYCGIIIEVFVGFDGDEIVFEYEDIWESERNKSL